jgi:hypothetical protein
MLYFILWLCFILAVILAVPVTALVENVQRKRALQKARGETAEEAVEEDAAVEVEEGEFGGVEQVQEFPEGEAFSEASEGASDFGDVDFDAPEAERR